MTTARLEVKLDKKIKAKAEKAYSLLGLKSLTEYVVKIVDDDATKVIAMHESVTIENDIFDRFMSVCKEAQNPNKALQKAVTFTRNQGVK